MPSGSATIPSFSAIVQVSKKNYVFSLFIPESLGKKIVRILLPSKVIEFLFFQDMIVVVATLSNSLVQKELEQISMDTSSVVDEWHGNSASRSTFGGYNGTVGKHTL